MPWHDLGVLAALVVALVWVYVSETAVRTEAETDIHNPT
jgi:hypothetical protein